MPTIDTFEDIIDRIDAAQRCAYIGPTRCGKSTAMVQVLKYFDNVVVTAPKEQFDWNLAPVDDLEEWKRKLERFGHRAYDIRDFDRELNAIASADSGDPLVFLPKRIPDRRLHHQILDYPFYRGLQRKNTLCAADDLYYHAHGTNFESAAPWLFYYITSGGGDGCGTHYAFQRPVWVPKVALSETEHFLVWYLQEQDDRDAIDARAGKERGGKSPIDWETLRNEDHSFVYFTKRFVSEPFVIDFEKEAA